MSDTGEICSSSSASIDDLLLLDNTVFWRETEGIKY